MEVRNAGGAAEKRLSDYIVASIQKNGTKPSIRYISLPRGELCVIEGERKC